tara:strand:+ start:826 stop:1629 length:804 start_codon:yes stop_codon:yes gene_type:complete
LSSNKPIGIFDSGIGGLTVANSINKLLPNEKIIYFGDTVHLPYGNKSPKKINEFSEKIVKFLLEKKCKAIVFACNSASATSFDNITKKYNGETIFFNVIDPVIDYIKSCKNFKNIGVIGTEATINSQVYSRKIYEAKKNILVKPMATPLLAGLIEDNKSTFFSNGILKEYLENKLLKGIDSLILGCTHYPIISQEISSIFKNTIEIISSDNLLSYELKNILKKNKILNKSGNQIKHQFFISDYSKSFQLKSKMFFKSEIILEEENIF